MAEALIFEDTFTVASDTDLDSHTPDVGSSWAVSKNTGSAVPTLRCVAATDDLRASGADASAGLAYRAEASYDTADFLVQFKLVAGPTSDESMSIAVRADNALDNGYVFEGWWADNHDPRILRVTSGSFTQLAIWDSSNFILYANTDVVYCQVLGDDLMMYDKNEIAHLYATDSNHTSANKVHVAYGALANTADDMSTSIPVIDDFKIYQLGANKTSWNAPTTTGEVSNQFTNPSNAYASDGSYATAATVGFKQDYGDFGFSVPSDATIRGVMVLVEAKFSGSGELTLGVEVSNDNGATWSARKDIIYETTADEVKIAGHGRSLWGLTWTGTDVDNNNLRVRLTYQANSTAFGRTMSVDQVAVKVVYDIPAPDFSTTLTESVTLVDTIRKSTTKVIANAITLVDTAVKHTAKIINNTITLVDPAVSITAGTLEETYTETVTLVDSVIKQGQKIFAEAITAVDSIIKSTGKVLAEAVTAVDTITIIKTLQRTYSEAVALADVLLKQTSRTLSEAVALVDTAVKQAGKTLTDVTTLADTMLRQGGKTLLEAVTLVDSLVRSATKVLAEAAVLVDSIVFAKTFYRTYEEAVALADTIVRQLQRSLVEAVTLVDSAVKLSSRAFAEAITLTDTVLNQAQKVLSEAVALVDSILNEVIFTKILEEAVTLTETFLRQIYKVAAEAVSVTDTLLRQINRQFAESVTLADTLLKTAAKTFAEGVALVDSLLKSTARVFDEAIVITDTLIRTLQRQFSEIIALADTFTQQVAKTLTEAITATDTLIKSFNRQLAEAVALTDTLIRVQLRDFAESLALSDNLLIGIAGRILSETITIGDTLLTALRGIMRKGINILLTTGQKTGGLLKTMGNTILGTKRPSRTNTLTTKGGSILKSSNNDKTVLK